MAIFKVKSNLTHNGDRYEAGNLIEGDDAAFQPLVADGVLEVVEGAATAEEAKDIIAAQESEEAAKPAAEPEAKPADTWGAQPDPVTPAEGAETAPDADAAAAEGQEAATPTTDAPAADSAATAEALGANL